MWALVQKGIVLELTEIDPAGRYHEGLTWYPCGAEVRPGWEFGNGDFTAKIVSADVLTAEARGWRNGEVGASEWLIARHRDEIDMKMTTTLLADQFAELLQYRQALRDWPQDELFPGIEHRPTPPSWLSSLAP